MIGELLYMLRGMLAGECVRGMVKRSSRGVAAVIAGIPSCPVYSPAQGIHVDCDDRRCQKSYSS